MTWAFLPSSALAKDDFIDEFFTNNLAEIDWSNEKQINEITKDWADYNKDQAGGKELLGRIILKERKSTNKQHPMTASLRKITGSGRYEIVFLGDREFLGKTGMVKFSPDKFSTCDKIVKSFEEIFSTTYKKIDTSRSSADGKHEKKGELAISQLNAQWKMGKTDFIIRCAIFRAYDSLTTPIIIYAINHDDDAADIQDNVFLKCEHHAKLYGKVLNKSQSEESPINIIIDPNTESVSSGTHSFINGKITLYDKNNIIIEYEESKKKTMFRLDRNLGNYSYNTQLKNDTTTGIEGWGDCKKVDPSEKM